MSAAAAPAAVDNQTGLLDEIDAALKACIYDDQSNPDASTRKWDALFKPFNAAVNDKYMGVLYAAILLLAPHLGAINRKNVLRNQRLDALEAKLAALEQQPRGLEYCGSFQRAQGYKRHQGVTHAGSLWVCVTDTTSGETPGEGSKAWQLAAKRGTNGRDAR